MECLVLWVTCDGIKPIDKKYKQLKYEAADFPKISTSVYRCSELLLQYVVNTFTYAIFFN